MDTAKAIFFDRDNTLNRDPDGYIGDWVKIEAMPGAETVVQQALAAGYLLFLITNQSGVGRGMFSLEAVHRCNERLIELLGGGKIFSEIGISTGTPDNPDRYRKPSPLFFQEMCAKYGLTPRRCWVVGDRESDMEMAARGSTRGVLVHGGAVSLGSAAEKACFGRFSTLESAWNFMGRHDG